MGFEWASEIFAIMLELYFKVKMMKEIGKKAMLPVSVMLGKGKKVILFLVIGQVKIFHRSPARTIECV